MTDSDISAPPSPSAGTPRPSSFERITGVLISPGETFESIARQPDWLIPLAIILVITIASGVLIAGHVDFGALGREAVEMNPRAAEMSGSQIDAGARVSAAFMRIAAYASPVLVILALLVVAGVLLATFRAFGGEGDFRRAFAVATYAWYPRLIKGILGTVVIFTRSSLSIFDLQNPVMSNLGFLFDGKTQPLLFALGSAIDLFAIWSVILLIIGFAAVSRLPRSRSAGIVLGWWIVVNIVLLIGPAIQAMRQ